ncbi:hypothetical protein [Salinicoccus halitifaciens]|uniref:Anti-bacteriophage protein A/HamA C-terminal domain-containing protein n=1 Tax=Salinicoccus halitifaciens TaxID=1073415 RepID=A0ABV2EAZ8_9STAP|nr:hypothetical protein [Salinicoccus halitifaciens]MCD2137559.1 hypothetical protein [Salinicoccus halitifaciens]
MNESIFDFEIKMLNKNIELHYISIKEIDEPFKKYLDKMFVKICGGSSSKRNLNVMKERVRKFYENKDIKTRIGATAEFILHLYLNKIGYKQECMFLNMEENSIKKGFDGFYSFQNEPWIMESKSGMESTTNNSHKNKIKEAYNSLEKQVTGSSTNDPWQNAYNHANTKSVNTDESILELIENLSDNYMINKFAKLEDLNLIPCGTIFLQGTWKDYDTEDLKRVLEKMIKKFDYNNLLVICMTKLSLDLFMDYLYKEG